MIEKFNFPKKNNLLKFSNLRYLSIPFYLQNSIIGMESDNSHNVINNEKKIVSNKNASNKPISLTGNEIFKKNVEKLLKTNRSYLKRLKPLLSLKFEDYEEKKKNDESFLNTLNYLSISEFSSIIHSSEISTICRCKISKGNNIFKNAEYDIELCYKFLNKESDYIINERMPIFKRNIPKNTKGFKNVIGIVLSMRNDYIDLVVTEYYYLRNLSVFNRYMRKKKDQYFKNYEIATLFYFKNIMDGYGLLYDQSILHNDIKPENIFMSIANDLVISDFSVAKKYDKNEPMRLKADGTRSYMSLELFERSEIDGLEVNKVDMYSIGCTLYETLFGKSWIEFGDIAKNDKKYIEKIKSEVLVIKDVHKATEDLLRNLLAVNYKDRADYLDIVNSDIYKLTTKFEEPYKEWREAVDKGINNNGYKLSIDEKDVFCLYLENVKKDFLKDFEEELEKCKPIKIDNNNNFVIFGDVLDNYINNTENNINNNNDNIKNNINNINDNNNVNNNKIDNNNDINENK